MPRMLAILCLLALTACGGCLAKQQATNRPEFTAPRKEAEPVPKWAGPATWWDAHPVLTVTGLVAGIAALCALVVACWAAAGGPVL